MTFSVEVEPGPRLSLTVAGPDSVTAELRLRRYELSARDQQNYLDLFALIGRDFGTRLPRNRLPGCAGITDPAWTPLLTENIASGIRYGYGDPAVLRVDEAGTAAYYAFVTSNDAPDSFPILKSHDLCRWEMRGFVFPRDMQPAWAARGAGSDFWAPEVHRVGGEYLLCFTAREPDGTLAVGLARSRTPEGPFAPDDAPLLRGGMIDAHIVVDEGQGPVLIWKEDSNGRWPASLAGMLHRRPDLIPVLFTDAADRRTAALAAAFWPMLTGVPSMERFLILQPLIEAAVDNLADVRAALVDIGTPAAADVVAAMQTPVFAQRLSADRGQLIGDRRVILVNDLEWEGHLIEGPWIVPWEGRYFLFYAGNDFCTSRYGIGVAVSDTLFGPYRKQPEPLLRSSAEWIGPGHPSVAIDPEGAPRLFFHAYLPTGTGYRAFRAMLSAGLRFNGSDVSLAL